MNPAAPSPDELIELLFSEVLEPPEGYEYYPTERNAQLLYPMYGTDQWRILLQKKGAKDWNPYPIVLEGEFVRKVARALHAMQDALNSAISDDIPDIKHASN